MLKFNFEINEMNATLNIQKVIYLLCLLFTALALIKNNELAYAYLGFDIQMQNGVLLFSKNNFIITISIILILILVIKKNYIYLLLISPIIILITYFQLDYNYYFFIILFITSYIIFTILFINSHYKNKIIFYIFIIFISMLITINFILIDRKYLTSDKFKTIFNIKYNKIKTSDNGSLEVVCNNIKLNKYTRNKADNCTYNFEGTFSGNIPFKFYPIYNESGVFTGYTDIIYSYDKSSTINIFKNTFYLKSEMPLSKALLHKNKCYITSESLIYSILNDQIDCDETTDLKKIEGYDELLGKVFFNLKIDERYNYYGTYVNGDHFKGVISFPITKNEKFQIITGPSSENLFIELYAKNNKLLYKENLKVYNSWTDVTINNLSNFEDFTYLKLIDEGNKWGQWLGIRVIK